MNSNLFPPDDFTAVDGEEDILDVDQSDSNVKFETVEGSNLREAFQMGDDNAEQNDDTTGFIKIKLKPAKGRNYCETFMREIRGQGST